MAAIAGESSGAIAETQRQKKAPSPLRDRLIAWIWVGPAIVIVGVLLVWPVINTIWMSLLDNSSNFTGLANYKFIFTDPAMLQVLENNLLWLVVGTVATVFLGLVIAVLVDRVKIESIAKSAIFIPMAISFVGAGVIWTFMYDFSPAGTVQIGLLNAILTRFGFAPHAWIIDQPLNNFCLIAVYVWMWTGFCMVILSAALKGIPADIMEAARVDGANEFQIFFRITVPMISPTIVVVATTMIINVLKIFDIIYVMTGGDFGTSVIAFQFIQEFFTYNNYGIASAFAVILLAAIIPIMYFNIKRFRAEGQR